MDTQQNRFISVSYQLYSIDQDGRKHLEEQTQQGQPYQFISGFGFSLDAFEKQLIGLEQGAKFDFTLKPDEAFGPYIEQGVHRMGRDKFVVDGQFDTKKIYPGAVIVVHDDQEHRYMARVTDVDADGVTIDTNHPLAGLSLQFSGLVLENRAPTTAEIQDMLTRMSHECGGCGGCGGDCDCDNEAGCCCH